MADEKAPKETPEEEAPAEAPTEVPTDDVVEAAKTVPPAPEGFAYDPDPRQLNRNGEHVYERPGARTPDGSLILNSTPESRGDV